MKKEYFCKVFIFLVLFSLINVSFLIAESTKDYVTIQSVNQIDNGLNIIYSFDNKDFIGENMAVDIWVQDSRNIELNRMTDVFSMLKDGLIKRNVTLEIPDNFSGDVSINLELSDFSYEPIKQDFFVSPKEIVKNDSLGKGFTGFAILSSSKGKFAIYVVFIVIVALVIFFIFWQGFFRKKSEKEEKSKSKVENKDDSGSVL